MAVSMRLPLGLSPCGQVQWTLPAHLIFACVLLHIWDVQSQSTAGPQGNPALEGQQNPCPSLNTEVAENTPVGAILFTFDTSASRIGLDTSRDPRFQGYLGLSQAGPQRYHVVLTRTLDLNSLNPRRQPVPNTEENINCQYDQQQTNSEVAIKSIWVTLRCEVPYSQTTVQVSSDVRVAIKDVNDKSPFFLCAPYYKQISELTPISTTVFTLKGLAADPDIEGGIAGYNLQDDAGGMFGIQGASSDGFVVLQRQLDYDRGQRLFVLNVSTTDIGDPPLSNWTQLFLTVTDGDDQNPTFSHDIYQLALPEHNTSLINMPLRTNPPIQAYDLDFGLNASIAYTLDGGHIVNGQTYFDIDRNTGEVIPRWVLDRTIQVQFVIRIKAFQVNNPEYRSSFATLVVTVEDTNVHAPTMDRLLYNVSVPEHARNGYRVTQVLATDSDMGNNAVIEYYLLDPLDTHAFDIEATSGIIFVADTDKLDKEKTDYFFLQVYAQETSTVERYASETANVYVWLEDVNDNAPIFRPEPTYNFVVNSSSPINTVVGYVYADDEDSGHNGRVRYELLFGTHGASEYLGLDADTGAIYLRKSLKQAGIRTFIVTVQASDTPSNSDGTRTSVAMVNVTAVSGNDHPPVFISAPYSASVSEASAYGTTILQLKTEDKDGSPVEYRLVSGDEANNFILHQSSGVITLWRPLDRENIASYSLTVSASDSAHTVETRVFIEVEDANDNLPVFSQQEYTFYAREEQRAGTVVGTVTATDRDVGNNGQIRYLLGGSWSNQYFSIDSAIGHLYNIAPLDRERTDRYQLTVIARDNGYPRQNSVVTVNIFIMDINDHPPAFSRHSYQVSLVERAPPSPIIQLEASDLDEGDNALVFYKLTQGDSSLFAVDGTSGILYSLKELNLQGAPQEREVVTQHHLIVTAYNQRQYDVATIQNASVSVIVTIEDVNDNIPVFVMPTYSAHLYENHPVGSSVLRLKLWTSDDVSGACRVMASDADLSRWNHGATFWLGDEAARYKFMVERNTGVIRLVRPLNTDIPDRDRGFVFTVYASDMTPTHGSNEIRNVSARVNITVLDINDNTPQFGKDVYKVSVREDAVPGTVVMDTLHAVDVDVPPQNTVIYDLLTYGVPFEVYMATGRLTLRGSLDYDSGPRHYSLLVVAIDEGRPARTGSATVEISVENINDNVPEFDTSSLSLAVLENLPSGTFIGQVTATDLDGDKVYYAFNGGETDLFHLDNETGQIFTKVSLDYEHMTSYTLTVLAADWLIQPDVAAGRDHVSSARVQIEVVDQNDNAPVFSHSWYQASAKEGASNQTILQLEATDADSGWDGTLTYHILSGNEDGIFHLEPSSGRLWVVRGDQLDHLRAAQRRLIVLAKDGGIPPHSTTAEVIIIVDATNSHPPRFSLPHYEANVRENQPPGAVVIQVSAMDPDPEGSLTFQLVPPAGPFSIDSLTGRISTSRQLDREAGPAKHHLNVSAYDGINYNYVNVTVTVEDVNDNAPLFTQSTYTASVSQNTNVGRTVLTVSATDEDASYNGYVTYWITGTDGKFSIRPETGEVVVVDRLNVGAKSVYHLKAYTRDHGIPAQTASADVTLYLNDSNQYPPVFESLIHETSVPENVALNTTVMRLSVSDKDEGRAGQVALRIVSGNPGYVFRLLQNGELKVVRNLDFEKVRHYQLHIEARDLADNPQTSLVVAHVTVTDVNDNAPQILPLPERLRYFGTVAPGQVLLTVFALDADSKVDGNDNITFYLPEQQRFSIDPRTGRLTTRNFIGQGSFQVTIQARDAGSPVLYSLKAITLEVLAPETARYFPAFSQPVYRVALEESVSVPRALINLDATVPGQRADVNVGYAIVEGNDKGLFYIDPNTGEIRLVSSLNWIDQRIHSLVISATNRDSPLNSRATMVVVEVGNSDDEPPFFPYSIYTASVPEDAALDTVVKVLTATDNDMNRMIWYGVTNRQDNGALKVESINNTAVVKVQRPLDRDSMPPSLNNMYIMEIGASDGRHYSFPTTLRVLIMDVNDNDPVFNTTVGYTASISESAGGCQEVIKVFADDPDLVDEGKIVYSISSGDSGIFSVNPTSGMVSVRCDQTPVNLDREYQDSYSLSVTATDTGGRQATTSVFITVQDDNDNAPRFIGEPYVAHTTEGELSRELVTYVSVSDADAGNNSKVTFSLRPEDDEFAIYTRAQADHTLGQIRVVRELDREKMGLSIVNGTALYPLRVLAADHGSPAQTGTTTVSIYIADLNDHPPAFVDPLYRVTIAEGTPPGTSILAVTATDPDSASDLRFSFDEESPFSIGELDGEIRVDWPLDAGQLNEYRLTMRVTDGKYADTAALSIELIDTNNHSPQFSQSVYYFRVLENDLSGQLGQVVGQVVASDRDGGDNGRITYHLTSRNAKGRFEIIEPEVGQIVTAGKLDRETTDTYTLIVTATDMGIPPRMSTCEVEVELDDANDNAPHFIDAPYRGEVDEHAPPGTPLFVFPSIKAADSDIGPNAELVFSLEGAYSRWFRIDPLTAAIVMSEEGSQQVDRETNPMFNLEVIARDRNGSSGSLQNATALIVHVGDLNDNAPTFEHAVYRFSIPETAWPGTEVGRVRAVDVDADPNNRLAFSISTGGHGHFYVDRTTGVISVVGGLDREQTPFYLLTVSVTDSGVTPGPLEGSTLVNITVIDINDNAPRFDKSEYEFSVTENQRDNVYIGLVHAKDRDESENAKLTYELITQDVPFRVEAETGWLSFLEPLDREHLAQYDLVVRAFDAGSPPQQATVAVRVKVLDTNDNAPHFDQDTYRATLLERTPVGAVVLYARATDADTGDDGRVSYSIYSDTKAVEYFRVDTDSGLVTLGRPVLKADLQRQGIISGTGNDTMALWVRATDGGQPARTGDALLEVHVDEINDDAPQFTRISYRVALQEEVPAEMMVLAVEATSKNPATRISYSILHTNLFKIPDPQSGNIVTTGRRLDRESQALHSFTVKAVDNRVPQGTAFTAVLVTLVDINDNEPRFTRHPSTFEVSEGAASEQLTLAFMEASDSDEPGPNSQVRYSLQVLDKSDHPFAIEPSTGQLQITRPLDREDCPFYRLSVQATDGGSPPRSSTVEVSVKVTDINDNAPAFIGAPYEATIASLAHSGSEVIAVLADDIDEGMNGTVIYELVPNGNQPLPFYIQSRGGTGVIYVLGGLHINPDEPRVYDLLVQASDLGTPTRTQRAHVFVNITGRSSGVPLFSQDIYDVQILSNTPIGDAIFQASAGRGNFYYSIINGDGDGIFSIKEEHGTVVLMRPLSLQRTTYELTIQAHDNSIPKNIDTALVRIYVTQSGPVPSFDRRSYTAVLTENAAPPQLLVDLSTTDERLGRPVTYYILEGSDDNTFYIENATGRLWCTKQLDREQRATYRIVVGVERVPLAGDMGRRRRDLTGSLNIAEVVLEVGDQNDNPPHFPEDPVIVGIPTDASYNHLVTTLQIEDADSGNNSRVVFNASDTEFHVSPTGEIRSRRAFRQDDGRIFNFTVTATDNFGSGLSTTGHVRIYRLSPDQRAILVATIPPSEFKARQAEVVKALSAILGWKVYIEKLEPHISSDKTIDFGMTDMFFYAVDMNKSAIVSRSDVIRRVSEKSSQIEKLFNNYAVAEVKPVAMASTDALISGAELALIVIAVLIFFGAIMGTAIVIFSYIKGKKYSGKDVTMSPLYVNVHGRKKNDFKLRNPLYADSDAYSDPLELDNLNLMYPSPAARQRETQKISVYLPSENEDSSSTNTTQTEFVSFDDDGKAIIVVDNLAPSKTSKIEASDRTDADSSAGGWVTPYSGDTYAQHIDNLQPYVRDARSAPQRYSWSFESTSSSRLGALRDKLRCLNFFSWGKSRVKHSDLASRSNSCRVRHVKRNGAIVHNDNTVKDTILLNGEDLQDGPKLSRRPTVTRRQLAASDPNYILHPNPLGSETESTRCLAENDSIIVNHSDQVARSSPSPPPTAADDFVSSGDCIVPLMVSSPGCKNKRRGDVVVTGEDLLVYRPSTSGLQHGATQSKRKRQSQPPAHTPSSCDSSFEDSPSEPLNKLVRSHNSLSARRPGAARPKASLPPPRLVHSLGRAQNKTGFVRFEIDGDPETYSTYRSSIESACLPRGPVLRQALHEIVRDAGDADSEACDTPLPGSVPESGQEDSNSGQSTFRSQGSDPSPCNPHATVVTPSVVVLNQSPSGGQSVANDAAIHSSHLILPQMDGGSANNPLYGYNEKVERPRKLHSNHQHPNGIVKNIRKIINSYGDHSARSSKTESQTKNQRCPEAPDSARTQEVERSNCRSNTPVKRTPFHSKLAFLKPSPLSSASRDQPLYEQKSTYF